MLKIGNLQGKKHFNSIKVQLKRANLGILTNVRKFQFHKGTIKTTGRTADGCRSTISIP